MKCIFLFFVFRNIIEMELATNLSFIEAAAQQLIGPKSCSYNSHQIYNEMIKYPHLKCQVITIKCSQNSNQSFNAFFIYNKNKPVQPCIVYLHGLSSYCFEGLYLLQYVSENYNLCIYDLRGHGKNKSLQVTYGIKQASDLYDLIIDLNQKKISQVYVWGRSMGASTILNFLNLYNNLQIIKRNIKFAVLDSPFCSFEKISKQTIGNNLRLPSFVCSPLVSVTFTRIFQKYNINFRSLEFQNLSNVKCPSIFIYSQKDNIVNWSHSQSIIKGYGGKYHSLKGHFSHNQQRPVQITKQVLRLMSLRKMSRTNSTATSKKGLSISLMSCNNIKQNNQKENIPTNILPNYNYMQTYNTKKYEIAQQQCISLAIKKDLLQNKIKMPNEQHYIQQRSKSKQKPKSRPPTLTNRRYL